MKNTTIKCQYLECSEDAEFQNENSTQKYCIYHRKGGSLGNGESYRQYQIIEEDFINFIKIVPLTPDHFNVYSPVLRDIIIRVCVQIELFFKEWSKQYCSFYWKENPLLDKFMNKNKGTRNWSIGDYFIFKNEFNNINAVYVLPLDIVIMPFDTWLSEKKPPSWWEVYNEIKHSSKPNNQLKHNLKTALESLAALYLMHYTNDYSRSYLKHFVTTSVQITGFAKLKTTSEGYTTPIETKQYLFKITNTGSHSEHDFPEEIDRRKALNF